MRSLSNLSFSQVQIISQLSGARGIRDLARQNNIDPAAVSRLIKEAEIHFGFALITRSQKGISLTVEGRQAVALCREVISVMGKVEELRPNERSSKAQHSFVLGTRGYLAVSLSGLIAQTSIEKSGCRFKFMDSSPSVLLQSCLTGSVDIAVHFEDWSWPSSWVTNNTGNISWGLVVREEHPMKSKIEAREVIKYPFITSSYLLEDRVERIPDAFPVRLSERWLGHEAQTAFASKSILLNSNHVAFLPLISMEHEILSKQIRVIKVTDMDPVQMPLRLSYHQDRVLNKAATAVSAALKALTALDQKLLSLKS